MDTLGETVDKLITVNLKLWHVVDWTRGVDSGRVDLDAMSADEIKQKISQLIKLNDQRNKLMTRIDELGGGRVDPRIKM